LRDATCRGRRAHVIPIRFEIGSSKQARGLGPWTPSRECVLRTTWVEAAKPPAFFDEPISMRIGITPS
jgi:hypothetical protein